MKYLIVNIIFLFFGSFLFAQKTEKQLKVEQAVENYVFELSKENAEYKSYSFGDLIIDNPAEFIFLDSIVNVKRNKISNYEKMSKIAKKRKDEINYNLYIDSAKATQVYYDEIINSKKAEIKEKKVYPIYEINHVFTLKESSKNPVLHDITFYFYPNYKIKNIDLHLKHELIGKDEDLFYHYFMHYPLFDPDVIENSTDYDKTIYGILDSLMIYETKELKPAVLNTALAITDVIQNYNYIDSSKVIQTLVRKWIYTSQVKYDSYKFSKVESIQKDGEKIGYKIFLKLISKNENEKTAKGYYFEFDKNYVLYQVLLLKPPFEEYFE